MPPCIVHQLREDIVSWYFDSSLPVSDIAELARCSTTTIYIILAQFRQSGDVSTSTPPGRPHSLSREDVDFITSLIDINPVIFLDEMQKELEQVRGVRVSLATISRTLHNLALSNKKVSKAALEQNGLLCATWLAEWGDLLVECLVWIDESSVDGHTNQQRRGWAEAG